MTTDLAQPMRHQNNFDALRLLGALLVLLGHQFPLSDRPEPHIWPPSLTLESLGVSIFFSISGFLVCRSWLSDPDPYRFTLRRFLRIWPGMAVALITSSVIIAALVSREWIRIVTYMSNLVCLGCDRGQFFPGNRYPELYGSLWTIPLEVECYMLLLFVALIFRDKLRTVAAIAVGLLAVQTITSIAGFPWLRWPVGQLGAFFLVGCLLGFDDRMVRRPIIPVLLGVLIVAAGELTAGLAVLVPVMVVYVGTRSWPALRDAGRWGDLSYGVYLYAWPVQQYLIWKLGKQTPVFELMTYSILMTFALALASWHLIEKRALRFKPARPVGLETAHLARPQMRNMSADGDARLMQSAERPLS